MGYLGRWRWEGPRIGYPDAGVSIALACGGRWCRSSAGVGKGAKTGFPDAGVSIALACGGRWRGKGAKTGFPSAGISIALACEGSKAIHHSSRR
jgi:hypothetical protein